MAIYEGERGEEKEEEEKEEGCRKDLKMMTSKRNLKMVKEKKKSIVKHAPWNLSKEDQKIKT